MIDNLWLIIITCLSISPFVCCLFIIVVIIVIIIVLACNIYIFKYCNKYCECCDYIFYENTNLYHAKCCIYKNCFNDCEKDCGKCCIYKNCFNDCRKCCIYWNWCQQQNTIKPAE